MKRRWLVLAGTALVDVAIAAVVVPVFGVTAAANVFLAVLMIKAVLFVVLYGTRSNWRATPGGRAVMTLIACIGAVCLIGTLGAYLGHYPGRAYVRLGAFIAVGLTLMNLLLTLADAQRAPRDRTDR